MLFVFLMAHRHVSCPHCGEPVFNVTSVEPVSAIFCWTTSIKACTPNIHERIITLTMEGLGVRAIARVLKISLSTVIKHLKKNWTHGNTSNALCTRKSRLWSCKLMNNGLMSGLKNNKVGSFMRMSHATNVSLLMCLGHAPKRRSEAYWTSYRGLMCLFLHRWLGALSRPAPERKTYPRETIDTEHWTRKFELTSTTQASRTKGPWVLSLYWDSW